MTTMTTVVEVLQCAVCHTFRVDTSPRLLWGEDVTDCDDPTVHEGFPCAHPAHPPVTVQVCDGCLGVTP